MAIQLLQRRAVAHIQFRQLIAITVEIPRQFRVRTYIQLRQRIVGAVKRHQFRIRTYIQLRQLIVGAGQIRQLRVRTYIQLRQLIVKAD